MNSGFVRLGLACRALFLLTPLVLPSGCFFGGSPDRYTQTGLRQPAKPGTCDFQFLSLPPSQAYEEVGIVDAYKSQTRDTGDFVSGIRPLVCAAGGDAAIAEKSGNGFYYKATVIKFKAP